MTAVLVIVNKQKLAYMESALAFMQRSVPKGMAQEVTSEMTLWGAVYKLVYT